MMRALWTVGAAVLLGACAAHDVNAELATKRSDWKRAYSEYEQALAASPGNADLQRRRDEARAHALESARRQALGCAEGQDWVCALQESTYVLSLAPGEAAMVELRARAGRQLALAHLDAASQRLQGGRLEEAYEDLHRAHTLSRAPEVVARGAPLRRQLLAAGRTRAQTLRAQGDDVGAQQLDTRLSTWDATTGEWAPQVEQTRGALYERLLQEGDLARSQRSWALADQKYQAALQFGPPGRAAALIEYVRHVAAGEQKLVQRDWDGATEAYRRALATGQDDGHAATRLAQAEVRPYRVAIRSALVRPITAGGRAWVGASTPAFFQRARALLEQARPGVTDAVEAAAQDIPAGNRPTLRVEATLPDGRRLATGAHTGVLGTWDAALVLPTNAFDPRRVTFEVVLEGEGAGQSLGVLSVPLGELVTQRELRLQGGAVLSLRLSSLPAPAAADALAGLVPVAPGRAPLRPADAATPASRRKPEGRALNEPAFQDYVDPAAAGAPHWYERPEAAAKPSP